MDWWTIAIIIWVALAFWPARVAGRKGHSFVGYFILSLSSSRWHCSWRTLFRIGVHRLDESRVA